MRSLILGTAGHIDHGKTALVKALTGVDTDRLKEEQERGITVDLGFAEYQPCEGILFGVVDVPGHEGFIRNMLAGATGMDLVLMVVAADEGVMPQTREHLAIVGLLGVPKLAVALTKVDLVDPDWLDLVADDVGDLLSGTPYESAPIVGVSAKTGEGLQDLGEALARLGQAAEEHRTGDLVRLPIDRVFTIRGAGTVVTGTLWSGTLSQGSKVRLLPGDQEGRVRAIQVHGKELSEAPAGTRVAVALKGSDVSHHELSRGQTVVEGTGWASSWMLTAYVGLLSDTGWILEQGQRVRLHLGTAEVLARVAVLSGDVLMGGEEGWVQFRMEEPVLGRVRDHFVIRSYSPVTTIGGGRIGEVLPRKRRTLKPGEGSLLKDRLDGNLDAAVLGLLEMAGVQGASIESLPQRTGFPKDELDQAVAALEGLNSIRRVEGRLFGGRTWSDIETTIRKRLQDYHETFPLRPGLVLEELRQVVPGTFGPRLAEAVIQGLASEGAVLIQKGRASLEEFRPVLTKDEEAFGNLLRVRLREAGLAPPSTRDLAEGSPDSDTVVDILRHLEDQGDVISLDGDFFIDAEALLQAGEEVVATLGGSAELGPAAFRKIIPVSRRHLLPILRFFDLKGITTRIGDSRSVSERLPEAWGTRPGQGT